MSHINPWLAVIIIAGTLGLIVAYVATSPRRLDRVLARHDLGEAIGRAEQQDSSEEEAS